MKKSRKNTSVFKDIAFEPHKVTLVPITPPTNTPFQAIAPSPVVQDESQTLINKGILELKNENAEEKLLIEEMEKPFHARNKGLLGRFNIKYSVRNIDVYPPSVGDTKWKIQVSIPEDLSIPLELRTTTWYGTINLKDTAGNLYIFRFPYHKLPELNSSRYKLDNFPVWLNNKTGVIDNNVSEYSLYQALYDYAHNNTQTTLNQDQIFKKYGMMNGTAAEIDFNIRNQGFGVSYEVYTNASTRDDRVRFSDNNKTRDITPPPRNTATSTTDNSTSATPQKTPSKMNPPAITQSNHWVNSLQLYELTVQRTANSDTIAKAIINRAKEIGDANGYIPILGTDTFAKTIKPHLLNLQHIIANGSFSNHISFMLSSYNNQTGVWGLTIIDGKQSLLKHISGLPRTNEAVEQFIKQTNDRMFNASKEQMESINDIIQQ